MLRITRQRRTDGTTSLVLEGRILGPWVAELEHHCAAVRASGSKLDLDLAGVRFLGAEAVELLRSLIDGGVRAHGPSPFVRAQLEGERHGTDPSA